jgi:predicted nuclease of predicted toxin-antitoxin system
MSSLFIELYLDEDVDVLVASLLLAHGFSALTAIQAGQLHRTDREQLEYAISQRKVLLTHNRADFEILALSYFARGEPHYGIIFAVRRSTYEIVNRLLIVLNQVTADEMQNQVRYI